MPARAAAGASSKNVVDGDSDFAYAVNVVSLKELQIAALREIRSCARISRQERILTRAGLSRRAVAIMGYKTFRSRYDAVPFVVEMQRQGHCVTTADVDGAFRVFIVA